MKVFEVTFCLKLARVPRKYGIFHLKLNNKPSKPFKLGKQGNSL